MAETEVPNEVQPHEAHAAGHDAGHGAHHAPTGFIRKYIFSIDHKVIGIQYILLALFSVVHGHDDVGADAHEAVVARDTRGRILGTLFPEGAPGGVMTPEFYLSLVTMHGTIMVFFVLTTAPQGGFGNYFLPIQIGADDMAFPVLNMLSFWVTFVGSRRARRGHLRLGRVGHRRRSAGGRATRRSAASGYLLQRAGAGDGRRTSGSSASPSSASPRCSARSTSSPRCSTCARRACR